MNIFIRISGKTYTFQYNDDENIDKYIILAFQKHLKFFGKDINQLISLDNCNFLHKSNFIVNGDIIRFGDGFTLQQNHNLITINHNYLGGASRNFTLNDIKYIKKLMYTSKI